SVPDASWGDARARTSDENAAASGGQLPVVGSSIDASLFKYLRPIPAPRESLIAVPLDAAALAHSAGPSARFADVRVIDAEGRQILYLVERASEPLSIDLTLERLSAIPKSIGARH